MNFKIEYPPAATPLDPNEIHELIPDYITTQGELNLLERENILVATEWAFSKKHADILTVTFAFNLHKRMFRRVWKWAGKPRTTNKNIGVSKEQISQQLKILLGNTDHWIQKNIYSWDELAARFHHRLVAIHPFANGNGRHARLMTDILLETYGQIPLSWGQKDSGDFLEAAGPIRSKYILALKQADANKFESLIKFMRS